MERVISRIGRIMIRLIARKTSAAVMSEMSSDSRATLRE